MRWASTVMGLGVVAVMAASAWWMVYWRGPAGWYVGARSGRVIVGRNPMLGIRGVGGGRHREGMRWWVQVDPPIDPQTGTRGFLYLYIPLWIPGGALLLPGAVGGARWVRGVVWGRRGLCGVCGYPKSPIVLGQIAHQNIGAEAGARCPECGSVGPVRGEASVGRLRA